MAEVALDFVVASHLDPRFVVMKGTCRTRHVPFSNFPFHCHAYRQVKPACFVSHSVLPRHLGRPVLVAVDGHPCGRGHTLYHLLYEGGRLRGRSILGYCGRGHPCLFLLMGIFCLDRPSDLDLRGRDLHGHQPC